MKTRNRPNPVTLFIVWALVRPAMKWKAVCDPMQRPSAVLVVRDEWKKGHIARIRTAPVAKAA